MIALETFQTAAQELHDTLMYPGVAGIDEHGRGVNYLWDGTEMDTVQVLPPDAPPFMVGRISVRNFVEALGMATASEDLGSIFVEEVNVLEATVISRTRRLNADALMNDAVREVERSRRIVSPALIPAHINSSVRAVEAERIARDAEFNVTQNYAHYQASIDILEGVEA